MSPAAPAVGTKASRPAPPRLPPGGPCLVGGPSGKPELVHGHFCANRALGEGEMGSELPHRVGRAPLAAGGGMSYYRGPSHRTLSKRGRQVVVHGRIPRGRDPEGEEVAGTTERRICKAKTGNGRQCRNPVLPGSQFCGRHERSDTPSPWWWTNAPELLRSWDEESLEVDERQRLELKRLFGPPRGGKTRTRRSGTGRRSTRRPSAVYRGRGNVDEG